MTDPIVSPENPQLKRCSKCGEPKPLGQFYVHSTARDGYKSECKECCCARSRQYRSEHKEASNERARAYYQANKAKIVEKSLAYAVANKEKVAARQHRWYEENKPRLLEERKKYRENNPDEVKRSHKAYRNSPEGHAKRMLAVYRRRVITQIAGSFTAADIKAIRIAQGNRCYLCGKKLTKYHIDHFIPLALGGSNDPGNLRLACPSCNLSKTNKHPFELGRLL